MFGAVQGLFVLAFALAITGLLPGWLGAVVIGAMGLLAVGWVILFIAAPLFRGFIDALR
jgi:hypothetical protein